MIALTKIEKSQKRWIFLSPFIFLILFPTNLFPQEKKFTFQFENQKRIVTVKTIGNDEYFSAIELLQLSKKRMQGVDPFLFADLNGISFLFLSGSFFFEIHTKFGYISTAQMNLPAITYFNTIYVPLKPFIEILSSLKILDCHFSKGKMIVNLKKTAKEEMKIASNQILKNPTKERNISENKIQTNQITNTQSSDSIPKFIKSSVDYFLLNPSSENQAFKLIPRRTDTKDTIVNIPPKYYVLPPKMKGK